MSNTGEAYTGTSGAMKKNSQWLSWEDIDGKGDIPVTIEGVYKHKDAIMKDGKKEPEVFTLKFTKGSKELVLNGTNRRYLATQFGADVTKWKGKNVFLYCVYGIRAFGGVTNGIRIKTKE